MPNQTNVLWHVLFLKGHHIFQFHHQYHQFHPKIQELNSLFHISTKIDLGMLKNIKILTFFSRCSLNSKSYNLGAGSNDLYSQ